MSRQWRQITIAILGQIIVDLNNSARLREAPQHFDGDFSVAQPQEYVRLYDFGNFQSSNPTTPLPTDQIEAKYKAVKTTTDEIRTNLALIQRHECQFAK